MPCTNVVLTAACTHMPRDLSHVPGASAVAQRCCRVALRAFLIDAAPLRAHGLDSLAGRVPCRKVVLTAACTHMPRDSCHVRCASAVAQWCCRVALRAFLVDAAPLRAHGFGSLSRQGALHMCDAHCSLHGRAKGFEPCLSCFSSGSVVLQSSSASLPGRRCARELMALAL